MSMERLREVLRNLPLSIYRLKGVFHVDAAPDQRVLIQVVGERISVTQLGCWERRIPENEVVAIGKGGAVNDRMLAEILDECVIDDVSSAEKGPLDYGCVAAHLGVETAFNHDSFCVHYCKCK